MPYSYNTTDDDDSQCQRTGCRRRTNPGFDYCCASCTAVARELLTADNLSRILGVNDATESLVRYASDFNYACDQVIKAKRRIRLAAMDSGYSHEDWRGMCRGVYPATDDQTYAGTG